MRAIEVENLTCSIGQRVVGVKGVCPILARVSFGVEAGEYLSIIGPNGAGKSTLLKCIMGVYSGWSGSVHIMGRSLESYTRIELARLISYVPQSVELFQPFSVYEFVSMGRYPYMGPFSSMKAGDTEAVRAALETTGTDGFADRSMATLSGGERQKVLIAGALAQGAQILLLDEPTTFLDPRHEHDILKIIRRINIEKGATVLCVTHNINTAALFSSSIVALKDGVLAFNGQPSELMNNDTLQYIYEKPFTFIAHPVTGIPVILPEVE